MGRLFWKFFSFILLAQLLATIAIGSTFWLRDRARDRREASLEMGPPAINTINAAALTLQYGGMQALREFARDIRGRHKVLAVDEQGRELLGREVNQKLLSQARQAQGQQKDRPIVRQIKTDDGHTYLLFLSRNDGEAGRFPGPPPGGKLMFGGRHSPPHQSGFMQLIPIISAIIASLIFAALLAWYFAKPIRHLRSAFRSVSTGSLAAKVGSAMGSRRDELADLGRDFDAMAAQVNLLMDGQRRLLHDVSHELRSPLARMQAAIGLAHQQPDKVQSTLGRIERESVRMDKLIDQLLTLSRLEAGVTISEPEEIRIDELLTELIDDARFEATAKSCSVVLAGSCSATVKGQIELLHSAIENVIRNAIKHTEKGSVVTVTCRMNSGKRTVHIDVTDCGPGVPEASLDDIFEPFYRASNNGQNSQGHGLGLAIAKRVVQLMNGSIQAANVPQGGLCVSLILPARMDAV